MSAVAPPAAGAPRTRLEDMPTVRLGRLDIGIAHFRFVDRTDPSAVPLDAALALSTPREQILLSPDAESLPSLELRVRGGANPVVGSISGDLTLTPYAVEPGFDIELAVEGIRGAGLTEVVPSLAAQLDGSGLEGGEFRTHASGALRLRRRHAADFDLTSGFGLDLDVDGFTLRDGPGGTPLAGFEALHAEVESIRPSGDVHIERIELTRPMGRVAVEPEGVRLLGLLVRTPEAPEPGDAPPAEADAATPDAELPEDALDTTASEAVAAADLPAEVRIDMLLIQGIDFELRDDSVTPPMVVPLEDLEFEVKRFTTRAFEAPRPISFRALVDAGEIQLPERKTGGSWLTRLAGEVGSVVVGDGPTEYEERAAFEEITAAGRLVLYPAPRGWTKVGVYGLELVNFKGVAAESGVKIGDGLVDTTVELRFLGADGLSINNRTQIDYLDVTEPENGPVKRYLGLPAPLASILFLLKNDGGGFDIPLRFGVGPDGVSVAAVSAAAGQTFLQLVADAIAGSPFRILGGALDLTGIDLSAEPVDLTDETLTLPFAPGTTEPSTAANGELADLVQLMREDDSVRLVLQHHFSPADHERMERLANPTHAEIEELTRRLRLRRAELLQQRDGQAARARAHYATGRDDAGDEARARVNDLDAELARTESALDDIAELLRPGADRRRERRTSDALRVLSAERLQTVRQRLLQAGIPGIGTRLTVRRARLGEVREGGAAVSVTPKRR